MTIDNEFSFELVRSLLNVAVTLITLVLGWFVGNRLSAAWAIRQKKREIELETVKEFYRIYGEFISTWKLWTYFKDQKIENITRWELLERASKSEGALESIYVKLSSERKNIGEMDVEILARFRQCYQKLRESIRDDKLLGWHRDKHPEEYESFKLLAGLVSDIILAVPQSKKQKVIAPNEAFMMLSSNEWESKWVVNEEDRLRLKNR